MSFRNRFSDSFSVLGKILGTVMLVTVGVVVSILGYLIISQDSGPLIGTDIAFLGWGIAVAFVSIFISVVIYNQILQEKIQWTY